MPFFARAVCARVKALAGMPLGCKHETESDDLEAEIDVVAFGAMGRPQARPAAGYAGVGG